jgi:hypothetical protein
MRTTTDTTTDTTMGMITGMITVADVQPRSGV